tara:strand:+ start:68 stop:472 length:405 start_codon:yes stop_codon:yes gene_type:complete
MLFVSGHSICDYVTPRVYEFFTSKYEIRSDVEICHCNLSDENALGFTEVNGEEQFIQIHNKDITFEEHCKTILHELMHVVQNEKGVIDEDKRESEAYEMEEVLYKEFYRNEMRKRVEKLTARWVSQQSGTQTLP